MTGNLTPGCTPGAASWDPGARSTQSRDGEEPRALRHTADSPYADSKHGPKALQKRSHKLTARVKRPCPHFTDGKQRHPEVRHFSIHWVNTEQGFADKNRNRSHQTLPKGKRGKRGRTGVEEPPPPQQWEEMEVG